VAVRGFLERCKDVLAVIATIVEIVAVTFAAWDEQR
jgi:hypothetical protein